VKILHLLETSIPHTVGYTIRARAIIEHQRRLGLDPVVVTSPLFPAKDRTVTVERYDGVPYYRTNYIPAPGSASLKVWSYAIRVMMLKRYRQAVLGIAQREHPDVLHAHSSYTNAYAAFPAARRLRLPLIYEVRTLWGESAVVEDGLQPDSWKHRLVWRLEIGAMRRADLVVPISQGIRAELTRRGVPPSKMAVVPNGVDSSRFIPGPRDEARARSVGLAGCFVIGFVGSLRRLEGLSTLLDAYSICRSRRDRIGLVIVGDGPDRRSLEAQAQQGGLSGAVFAGRVPHEEVLSWYSIIDVVVYPRIQAVINERVTPLKPLEAMALGKVCIGSDVGGLKELIRDGETGVIFPNGDSESLAAAISSLMDDKARVDRLGRAGREYVRREREWSTVGKRYCDLYDSVVSSKGVGQRS
jgi:PEP-CTERM/exosortase A-associated glycosyltransferase